MILRSILFLIAFHVSIVAQMIFWLPSYFFMKREDGWKVVRFWGWSSLWLHHVIVGTRFDFRGVENIPGEGGMIVASKHQSTWETYAILLFMKDPSYILKRELMFLPLFGWFAYKMKVVPVNRGKKSEALKAMTKVAKEQLENGRQIIIYPEGTRKMAHAGPSYKYGVTHMYKTIGPRILPVALNSGLFWPRRGLSLKQGTVVMEFLKVIEPGLSEKAFANKLEKVIEDKTAELVAEAEKDPVFLNS